MLCSYVVFLGGACSCLLGDRVVGRGVFFFLCFC